MKYLAQLLAVILLYFPQISFAQHNPEASQVLFESYNRYKTFQNVKIQFSQRTVNPSRNLDKTVNGTAYVKGKKHRIELPGQEIVSDGDNIWTYRKSQKKVFVKTYDPEDASLTPDKIFREDFLTRGLIFNKLIKNTNDPSNDVSEQPKNENIVEIIPTNKRRAYTKFLLYINRSNKLVSKWVVFMKNGSTITYDVQLFPNSYIKSSDFEPNFPQGVKVVDLRR